MCYVDPVALSPRAHDRCLPLEHHLDVNIRCSWSVWKVSETKKSYDVIESLRDLEKEVHFDWIE